MGAAGDAAGGAVALTGGNRPIKFVMSTVVRKPNSVPRPRGFSTGARA
jgi:hypothetical protein